MKPNNRNGYVDTKLANKQLLINKVTNYIVDKNKILFSIKRYHLLQSIVFS